jgi:hypothetical protein
MSAVVDAQPHGYDEVDAGDGVHGEAPEVHESADVSQGQDHHLRSILRTNLFYSCTKNLARFKTKKLYTNYKTS